MKNKVLIKLFIPEIDESFDIFVPVNELMWKIMKIILKSVNDLTSGVLDLNANYVLLNKDTSRIYGNNEILISTDIRNGTELLIIKK